MSPILPFWFKQRQCKAEPASGAHVLKVSGPNLAEAFIHIHSDNGLWRAGLRRTADGPDLAVCDAAAPTENAAWDAAFELYRTHVIS